MEGPFRKSRLGPKLGKHAAIRPYHVLNWRSRPGELCQDEFQRPPDQRKTVLGQRRRQTEFGEDHAVAFQNQSAAIDKRPIKIEYDQLHSAFPWLMDVAAVKPGRLDLALEKASCEARSAPRSYPTASYHAFALTLESSHLRRYIGRDEFSKPRCGGHHHSPRPARFQ
jgi:hypothetical protein